MQRPKMPAGVAYCRAQMPPPAPEKGPPQVLGTDCPVNADCFLCPLSLSTCEPGCHQIPAFCSLKALETVGDTPPHPSGALESVLGGPGVPWNLPVTGSCHERPLGVPPGPGLAGHRSVSTRPPCGVVLLFLHLAREMGCSGRSLGLHRWGLCLSCARSGLTGGSGASGTFQRQRGPLRPDLWAIRQIPDPARPRLPLPPPGFISQEPE